MNEKEKDGDGVCILSLDSGGPGAYSQLLILKEYMSRRANDLGIMEDDLYPADFFDLMGGVGFGGLVAIMLGHLRMKVEEAIETLLTIASAVFPEGYQEVIDRDRNTMKLKEAIEELLEGRSISPSTRMNEQNGSPVACKVVLYAAASANIKHPHAFRTYSSRGSSPNYTVVEAICATMAVPSHFSPVHIGPHLRQQKFIGSALGANNPTRLLLSEAGSIFGMERRVAQILSLGSGSAKVISLDSGLKEAGVSRLLNEMAADCEVVAQELSTRLFNVDAYLRLKVERGMDNICIDNWLDLGDIEAHTRVYFENSAVSAALDSSLRILQERIGSITLGQIMSSSSIKVDAKKAPSVSPYFVLRKQPWEAMVQHLVAFRSSRQKILPITGMGGCGKTQLVSYFLQEYPNLYKHTVYVDASSASSIKADFQTWARTLGRDHERDVWEDALRILNSLPQDQQCVLVLDNADDPGLKLASFLPKCINVTIMLTSRNRDVGILSTTCHLELGEMSTEEALRTLLRAARRQIPLATDEIESVQSLLKELGCLPVALIQAGTFVHRSAYTFTRYLSLFYTHRAELMKKSQPASLDSYERGAYTTLDLSHKALPRKSGEFLRLISFFHHADIPLEMIATAAKGHFLDPSSYLTRDEDYKVTVNQLKGLLCSNGEWNELVVQEFIHTLQSFSLLTANSINDSIFLHLHPLIQAWSRDMDDSRPYRAMAVQVLTACHSEDVFVLNRYLLPHIFDILGQIEPNHLHINSLMAFGAVLKQQGRYQRAATLFESAQAIMKISTEPGPTGVLAVSSVLGRTYRKEGRWSEAEKLGLEVLEQYREIKGREHPYTIHAAANLASVYSSQGRWIEAEKLEVEVLELLGRLHGVEHLDTIRAAANLSSTLYSQGRRKEAEIIDVEVLEKRRRIWGMGHPDTMMAAANLASTYHSQGRWKEAEELKIEVLEQRKKILGIEHPHTIKAASGLAMTYYSEHRWKECVALLAPAVQLSLKVLGQQHSSTQNRIQRLARAYKAMGEDQKAQEMKALLLSREPSVQSE